MTLPAFDTIPLGVDGPKYKVGPRCSNPNCRRFADHAHHIVRRSALGGDFVWVEVEGEVYGNLTGLCAYCHDDITGTVGGHRAAIRFMDGLFYWCDVRDRMGEVEYVPVAPIAPQPPAPNTLGGEAPRDDEQGSEECPTCGHKRRKAGSGAAPGPRRSRKTWMVQVPDDLEDGADILDTLVDDLAFDLGYEDEKSALRRYHTLVPALYWVQQNKKLFLVEMDAA